MSESLDHNNSIIGFLTASEDVSAVLGANVTCEDKEIRLLNVADTSVAGSSRMCKDFI
jgi:hypothetical protein